MKYYDEALRRLDKAIGIQLSQHSVKGLELHFSYRLQAWIKRELGKIEEGIDCAQKAMDQLKGETSEYRIEFAQVYNLFGVLYQEQKSYSLAIDYYKKSLALYEDQPLTAHLARAQICLNLGLALLADGNIGDATENFHKSTTLREEFLSPLHPDLAQSYHCLADTYWRKIDYDQASFYQAKSLAIYQAILPEDDLTLSESYNRMGALHLNKEDYSKALGYYQKSIAIKERLHGVKHRDLGPLLWRLGSIFLKLGHNNRAETAFNRSKEILEANLAQGVPELARLYLSMAINYSALIRFDDARLYIHKCLDIHKMNEQEDMETAEAYFHCGQVYSSLRYFQESVGPLKRCISIIIRLRGDRHISLKRSYQTLMYIYDQLGRSEEQKAIQLLLDGIGENQ